MAIAGGLIESAAQAAQNAGRLCRWSVQLFADRTDPFDWYCGFVLTCYHYAGVDVRKLGRTLECDVLWRLVINRDWAWSEESPIVPIPAPGDLVFYATARGKLHHVGLVRRFDLPAHDLVTIEGNSRGAVQEVHRAASSPEIFGYARIPDVLQGEIPAYVPPLAVA